MKFFLLRLLQNNDLTREQRKKRKRQKETERKRKREKGKDGENIKEHSTNPEKSETANEIEIVCA